VAVVLYHMFEAFCETGIDDVNGKDIGFGLVSIFFLFLPPCLGLTETIY